MYGMKHGAFLWLVGGAAHLAVPATAAGAGIECGQLPPGCLTTGPIVCTVGEPAVGKALGPDGALVAGFLGCIGLDPPPLLGDCNGDRCVDGADLGIVLSDWGPCSHGACFCDLSGDGVVDGTDLGLILSQWGNCGPEYRP